MAVNGNIFKVVVSGTTPPLIAGAKSDDIEVRCDTQEVASPTQGDWREFLAGRKEWSVNTSYLVSTGDLQKVLAVGTTYPVLFVDTRSGYELRGMAILVAAKITATKGNLTTGSFKFQGTGALTLVG